MKSKKFMITNRNEAEVIEQLIKEKINFDVVATNYTTEIKLIDTGHGYLFSSSSRPNYRLFSMLSKLKSEVKNVEIEENHEGNIRYYDLNAANFKTGKKTYGEFSEVINIDITAAYATVLKNKKYISPDLFNKIMALPKMDRLAIVGMLATKKIIYEIREGKEKSSRIETNEQRRKIFFEASKVVDELLIECREIAKETFLFFWVDGIYLKNTKHAQEIISKIELAGFSCKQQIFKNFKFAVNERAMYINYINEKGTEKNFNIPISQKNKVVSTIKKRANEN